MDETKRLNEHYHAKRIIDGKKFGCWLEKRKWRTFCLSVIVSKSPGVTIYLDVV